MTYCRSKISPNQSMSEVEGKEYQKERQDKARTEVMEKYYQHEQERKNYKDPKKIDAEKI